MLNYNVPSIDPPWAQYNLLESLNFKIYEWLPRALPYTPNPIFLNHISREHNTIAWHSDFRVQFPHSVQYRMLRAITQSNFQQMKKILKNPNFQIDQSIDKKYQYNALQFAAIINQYTVIELLLLYGANINKKDKYGNTALMYAVDRHNLESINSLMKNGCNRYQKNNYNMDPLIKASTKPNQQYLVQFLKNYPQTPRKFPKFRVKLKFQDKINNQFWDYVKKYKIFDVKPKLFPFNNFKGTYRIDLTPYQTVQSLIQKEKNTANKNTKLQKNKQMKK